MSEQVRRVWISTRAHDRATGEWLTVKGEVVPTDDYAALRAEAEALRAENERLRNAPCECGAPVGYVSGEKYAAEHERLRECRKERDAARAQLAAIQGGMGEADKHRAQPEVAENTGSHAMAKNQLSRQEQAVARDVEGVAAPCEASPGNDIFAWATFDGEGSYDLRLFDGNESYRDDFRRNNPRHHPDWVFPLYRNSMTAAMAAEVERLKRENANIRVKWTEYGRELEAERDALAAELAIARRVIGRIGQLCTTPHESKERFIRRVQSVIEWERAAQQEQPQ